MRTVGASRRGLLCGTALLVTVGIGAPALAQAPAPRPASTTAGASLGATAPTPGAPVAAASLGLPEGPASTAVDEVVVTGSRIARRDADSVGPLLTLTHDDIANSGASSVGDLLQRLPSAGVSLNQNGTQGTSYGASSINLRYLGGAEGSGNRTLVLIDGHRMVDGVGQRGFRDFVDLNTIPFGAIDGIEVLKDGASAIYGADAIAGVVNIHTVQKLEGVTLAAKYGTSDVGDGEERSFVANFGHRFGKTSIFLSASYIKDDAILTSDRALTTTTLVPLAAAPNSPYGLYILPGLASNAYFGTAAGFASVATPAARNRDVTAYGAGALADNSFHTAALPGDAYNIRAQGIDAEGPSERYGFFGRVTTEVTDHLRFKAEALYSHRESDQLFSPVQLDIGGTRGTVKGFALAVNQAFNPFGTANGVPAANALGFNATQAFELRVSTDAIGNRDNVQDVQTQRYSAGLEGDFDLFGRNWRWDAYGTAAENEMRSHNLNGVNYDNLFRALGSPAVCAATPGCTPVNLFGPMTADQAAYIRSNISEYNRTELYDFAANVTGELFQLPAGPLSIAAGYEYRENKAVDRPDPFTNAVSTVQPAGNPTTTNQTRTATTGSYSLNEEYVEISAPLLKDLPLVDRLEATAAVRYSDYDTVGGKTTTKFGLGYRPVHDVLLRGTFSEGFRAPSILELGQGARQTDFQGTDPCNGGAAAHANLPGCAGVPASYNQANFNGNGLLRGTISGNPNLAPETSNSYSLGIAVQPRFLHGFSFTSDWYRIVIDNAISSQTATQILSLCSTQGGVFCQLVQRDAGTGAVLNLIQGAQNLNRVETSGLDTDIRYDFTTPIGKFSAVLDTTYLARFRTLSPNPTGGAAIVDDRAGKGDTPRATYPRWKAQGSLGWTDGSTRLLYRLRYIGDSTDAVNPVKSASTASIVYQDFEAGHHFDRFGFDVTVGVSNLFDKSPPASYANAPINFDIYTYDVRGRYFYVRLASRF